MKASPFLQLFVKGMSVSPEGRKSFLVRVHHFLCSLDLYLQFRLVVLRQVAHVLNCVTKDSRERQIPLTLISPMMQFPANTTMARF